MPPDRSIRRWWLDLKIRRAGYILSKDATPQLLLRHPNAPLRLTEKEYAAIREIQARNDAESREQP